MLVRSTYVLHDTLGITSESVRSERQKQKERERQRQRRRDSVGGNRDGLSMRLLLDDVVTSPRTERLKGDRLPNGGPHPS